MELEISKSKIVGSLYSREKFYNYFKIGNPNFKACRRSVSSKSVKSVINEVESFNVD